MDELRCDISYARYTTCPPCQERRNAPGSVTDTIGDGWVKWAAGALAVALSPAVGGVALLAARDAFGWE